MLPWSVVYCEDRAHHWEQPSDQPGWLEQVSYVSPLSHLVYLVHLNQPCVALPLSHLVLVYLVHLNQPCVAGKVLLCFVFDTLSGICQGMSWQRLHQPCVAGQV